MKQKATKKTDKARKEELDVSSLTDQDLKAQLLKYGINPGPILGEFLFQTDDVYTHTHTLFIYTNTYCLI